MIARRLGLAALVLFGCSKSNSPTTPSRADATPSATAPAAHRDAAATSPAAESVNTAAPEDMLFALRGSSLRRALPLVFPQGGPLEVLVQLSRQATPGVGSHNEDIDADGPFVAVQTLATGAAAQPRLFVAWPLRPGMQIAQDARALHGYRLVSEGVYAPTSRDAGAEADDRCWVAQRAPVGWMLLCGPAAQLPGAASYLRAQLNSPENTNVLDVDVRPAVVARMLRQQLDEINSHEPPQAATGVEALRHAMFVEVQRSARLYSSIAGDLQAFHATFTQDESTMHLRAELQVERATTDQTRALIAASANRQAPPALLQALPATVQAWLVGGFDRERMVAALGEPSVNPMITAQAGPELTRVLQAIESIKHMSPPSERVDAYSNEDGYTMYHVIRRTDAARFVSDLRVAINSIPNRPLGDGGTLRDLALVMPTPGLTGDNYLRIGRNVHLPPGQAVPPEVRAEIERSMLVVAEADRLVAVVGRDPVARYRAMSEGARLNATVPPESVIAGRVNPGSFAPLFYGAGIPALPAPRTTDGVDFSVHVERRGEGARAELRADGPIAAAMELRGVYAMIQALEEQMAQAQQRQGQGGPGGQGGPRPQPRPQARPQLDPSMLPEPPRLQLPAPR